MAVSVLWFRRDLRLADNPALRAAMDAGDEVVGLFAVDPALWAPAGTPRRAFLAGCLRALDEDLGGRLVVVRGRPERVVPRIVAGTGASSVHVTTDYGPYGTARDARVERALGSVPLVRTGSPYAVPPGEVTKPDGGAYRMFTPYFRAWARCGWPGPVPAPRRVRWSRRVRGDGLPRAAAGGTRLPEAGERAGRARWRRFRSTLLTGYDSARDRPDLDATSRMSPYLHWGCMHPRTLLADLARAGRGDAAGAEAFRRQLAWRDFYADLLFQAPHAAREPFLTRLAGMRWDEGGHADEVFALWTRGRTGYPIVDAGMRQLGEEGWMHNRVRLIVASFLVKDLHLDWRRGARHFMRCLVDGDLASNQFNWQWVSGTAAEAAPFHRVFNPIVQGQRFDPHGDYVRRYVPELRDVAGRAVHEPWTLPEGPPGGYPPPLVDHGAARDEALLRYREAAGRP